MIPNPQRSTRKNVATSIFPQLSLSSDISFRTGGYPHCTYHFSFGENMTLFKSFSLATAVLGLCLSANANEAPKLYDADFCMRANIRCAEDSQFVHDQDGRCGCLEKADYIPAEICEVAFIHCPEELDMTFSTLSNGDEVVGCGCFATAWLE
jgi:hypothetical protein